MCYTYYTSKGKINRQLKRVNKQSVHCPSVKRQNRSSVSMFDFKRNFVICGQYCEVTLIAKNPGRWVKNRGILCRAADCAKGNKNLKEVILEAGYISYCRPILP